VVELVDGRLVLAGDTAALPFDAASHVTDRRDVGELLLVARWIERATGSGAARLLGATTAPASPRGGALPSYEIVSRRGMRRGR